MKVPRLVQPRVARTLCQRVPEMCQRRRNAEACDHGRLHSLASCFPLFIVF